MKTSYLFFCILLLSYSCSKDNKDDFLDQWIGVYEGTADQWSSYPGDSSFIESHEFKGVIAEVKKATIESAVNITLTFDSAQVKIYSDLVIDQQGHHFSEWGGGSGYGSLNLQFESDSLDFELFQKCGIPCDSGTKFKIGRMDI